MGKSIVNAGTRFRGWVESTPVPRYHQDLFPSLNRRIDSPPCTFTIKVSPPVLSVLYAAAVCGDMEA